MASNYLLIAYNDKKPKTAEYQRSIAISREDFTQLCSGGELELNGTPVTIINLITATVADTQAVVVVYKNSNP